MDLILTATTPQAGIHGRTRLALLQKVLVSIVSLVHCCKQSWCPSSVLFTATTLVSIVIVVHRYRPGVYRRCCSPLQTWCPSSLLLTATNLVSIVSVVHCYRPGMHRHCCSLLQPGDHGQCCSPLETVLVTTVSVVHR